MMSKSYNWMHNSQSCFVDCFGQSIAWIACKYMAWLWTPLEAHIWALNSRWSRCTPGHLPLEPQEAQSSAALVSNMYQCFCSLSAPRLSDRLNVAVLRLFDSSTGFWFIYVNHELPASRYETLWNGQRVGTKKLHINLQRRHCFFTLTLHAEICWIQFSQFFRFFTCFSSTFAGGTSPASRTASMPMRRMGTMGATLNRSDTLSQVSTSSFHFFVSWFACCNLLPTVLSESVLFYLPLWFQHVSAIVFAWMILDVARTRVVLHSTTAIERLQRLAANDCVATSGN